MNTSILTKEQLINIKKALPRGSQKKIARKLRKDTATVCLCLNGDERYYNKSIVKQALNIIKKEGNKESELLDCYEQIFKKSA